MIEKVFLETINYGNNRDLIDLDGISIDGSKTRAYANKYNNLTNEDVAKLSYIIKKGIITDLEENKALENRQNKTIKRENDNKEQIKEALRESQTSKSKIMTEPNPLKKLKTLMKKSENDKEQQTLDHYRKKSMKNSIQID